VGLRSEFLAGGTESRGERGVSALSFYPGSRRSPPTTEVGDRLMVAARVSPRREALERKARAVNEAAAHAITLGFTKESMTILNSEWSSAFAMLEVEEARPNGA
jgi:hypothetical protein